MLRPSILPLNLFSLSFTPMDAILASRLLPTHSAPLFSSSSHSNPLLPPFSRTRRIRIRTLPSKSPKLPPKFPPFGYKFIAFGSIEAYRSSSCSERVVKNEQVASSILNFSKAEGKLLKCIAKQIVLALLCFAIGLVPIRGLRFSAIAAPAVVEVLDKKEKGKEKGKGHEYADCTRRLLETVSVLLRSIEEVRQGGNGDLKQVEAAWKAVKTKKEELQDEIMNGLYAELRVLKRDKRRLEERSEKIGNAVVKTKREYDKSLGNAGKEGGGDRTERLEKSLRRLEEEYNSIWETIGEIEDKILRKETAAMSYGVRELCFIEGECEQLVQGFTREMRRNGTGRYKRLYFVVLKECIFYFFGCWFQKQSKNCQVQFLSLPKLTFCSTRVLARFEILLEYSLIS